MESRRLIRDVVEVGAEVAVEVAVAGVEEEGQPRTTNLSKY